MATLKSILTTSAIFIIAIDALKTYRPPKRDIKSQYTESEVPGIQFISRGYNIMFGNPHTTGNIDPGISLPIFNVNNFSNGETYNGDAVPNGVTKPVPASTCQQTFTYDAISGANSYSRSLLHSTSFNANIFKAAFSTSVTFQSVYKETSSEHRVLISDYTQCAVYSTELQAPNDLPAFQSNFYDEIQKMPTFYDSKNDSNLQFFYDFFTNYFGTLYITNYNGWNIWYFINNGTIFIFSIYIQ